MNRSFQAFPAQFRPLFNEFASSFLCLFVLIAFTLPAHSINLKQHLKQDSKVHVGKLENGLSYYIQQNQKPAKQVELRLVVKAGSIDEDEDQKGAAHFVEHLAFDGSKHFPNKSLIDTLRSLGIAFGEDLNASTYHDRTVYILPLPNNSEEDLKLALTVLKDWMRDISFDQVEIDREKSILKEETRLRKSGAERRIFENLLPHMLGESKYFTHEPGAKFDSIDNITSAALIRYYRQWYRPDNMAIIMVGDIEAEQGLHMIRNTFGDISKPKSGLAKRQRTEKHFKGNTAFVSQDEELSQEQFLIFSAPSEYSSTNTVEDLRDSLISDIFHRMVNKRLYTLSKQADPPFMGAGFSNFDYIPNHGWKYLSVVPNAKGRYVALESLWKEVLRINRFGFTQAELDYQKKNVSAEIKKSLLETDDIESANIISNILESYLYGDSIIESAQLQKYYADLLPSIRLQDFEKRAHRFFNKPTKLTTAFLHNGKQKDLQLSSSKIQKIAQDIRKTKARLKPWVQESAPTKLMQYAPAAGSIIEEVGPDVFGISKFKLSNGLEVWHKETDFKSNEVFFKLILPSGLSSTTDDNYLSTKYAPSFIFPLGVADFNPIQLSEVRAGKQYQLSATTADFEFSFSGTATENDLETALQELYLRIMSPRADRVRFDVGIANLEKLLPDYEANPEIQSFNRLNQIIYGNHPRTPHLTTVTELKQFSLDSMLLNYRNNVDNFNGAKATFVGNIKREKLKELAANYLASLPSKSMSLQMGHEYVQPRLGVYSEEIKIGNDNRAFVYIRLQGDTNYSRLARTQFHMLNEILNIRIHKNLREKLGLIYSESIESNFVRKPNQSYWISITLPCAPENTEKVIAAAREELKKLREELPFDEELTQVKKKYQADHDKDIKSNSEWVDRTIEAAEYNTPVDEFVYAPTRFWSVTPKQIRESAQQYYSMENVITVVRKPKKTTNKGDEKTQQANQ